jgi:hypothetical protein
MATLTAQVKLDCSGITSDPIAIDKSMTFTTVAGGIRSRSINDTAAAGETILSSAEYDAGTMIYLRNTHTSETINIELSASTTTIPLAAGQWAFFPWQAGVSLKAWAAANTPILEWGVFSAT